MSPLGAGEEIAAGDFFIKGTFPEVPPLESQARKGLGIFLLDKTQGYGIILLL